MRTVYLAILFTMLFAASAKSQTAPEPVQDDNPSEQSGVDSSQPDRKNASGERVSYPPNSHIRLEDIEAALEQFLGDDSSPPASQNEKRAEADLQAQQQMANYTLWMVWLGVGGLVLGGLGTALIYKTLKATQLATSAANMTLNAAMEANTTTRDALIVSKKQTRANVAIKIGRIKTLHDGENAIFPCIFTNFGSSSARIERLAVMVRITNSRTERPKFTASGNGESAFILSAGEENKSELSCFIKNGTVASLKSGEVTMHVGGYVIYKDIFNETRRTVFRVKGRPMNDDGSMSLSGTKYHNRAK